MVTQYGFFFDASACTGCKACQMACKDRNDLEPGVLWRRVYEVAGGGWEKKGEVWVPSVVAYNISMACNHCENPVCGLACPVKAISKREDGIVFVDTGACIGCRYCEWACPYTALRFDARTNTVSKCDFCYEAIDAGGSRRPASPPAPSGPSTSATWPSSGRKYGDVRQIFPLPDPAQTDPALVIKPHRDAARAAERGAEVANWEEV